LYKNIFLDISGAIKIGRYLRLPLKPANFTANIGNSLIAQSIQVGVPNIKRLVMNLLQPGTAFQNEYEEDLVQPNDWGEETVDFFHVSSTASVPDLLKVCHNHLSPSQHFS
jgi:hypothetical protein